MAVEPIVVPDNVTFEQAIALTQTLLDHLEQGDLPDSAVEPVVRALVSSENGARGFFVTYLSDDRSLADSPTPAITQAMSVAPEIVSPLLVKNLAMSTAMAITHRRNQNESLAQESDRVRSRTAQFIQTLRFPQLHEQAQLLVASIETGSGSYHTFFQRWRYDREQQQAIRHAIVQVGLLPVDG